MGVEKFTTLVLALLLVFIPAFLVAPSKAYAATSPSLGNAASFAVLAGTAITNVPTSDIFGDVGLSPAAGSNITGLTNLEVTGTIFAVDASGPAGSTGNNPTLVNNAKTDLITAYDGLSAAPNVACTVDYGAVDTDLANKSLVPGVYCSSTFSLSGSGTGTLTLNDTGAADGVWIFRSASTLITSAGGVASVVFATGVASSCNVWWKVPSSATIDTGTTFVGNILALTSISMKTGATLNGRALARNAAVTLESNTINQTCTSLRAPSSSSSSSSSSGGSASAPAARVCPVLNCATPLIIESRRVDADSIFLSWGPYAGISTFIIRYGLENGKWLYNTRVTGFSTTINALPPNQPIWVLIEPTDDCSIGSCGVAKLVGGPKLPNTGLGPRENNNPWYIQTDIFNRLSLKP